MNECCLFLLEIKSRKNRSTLLISEQMLEAYHRSRQMPIEQSKCEVREKGLFFVISFNRYGFRAKWIVGATIIYYQLQPLQPDLWYHSE
jgi:hypothetical protein